MGGIRVLMRLSVRGGWPTGRMKTWGASFGQSFSAQHRRPARMWRSTHSFRGRPSDTRAQWWLNQIKWGKALGDVETTPDDAGTTPGEVGEGRKSVAETAPLLERSSGVPRGDAGGMGMSEA